MMTGSGLYPGLAVHPVPGAQGGGGGGGARHEHRGQEHGGQVRTGWPDDGECDDDFAGTWIKPL